MQQKLTNDFEFTSLFLTHAIQLVASQAHLPDTLCTTLTGGKVARVKWDPRSFHLTIPDSFINDCLRSSHRFVYAPLILAPFWSVGHENVLFFDKRAKTIERFDPHGITEEGRAFYKTDALDQALAAHFANLGFTYASPTDLCPNFGRQGKHGPQIYEQAMSKQGFCQAWSLWWVLRRIQHPSEPAAQLLSQSMDFLQAKMDNGTLEDYFATFVNTIKERVFHAHPELKDYLLNSQKTSTQIISPLYRSTFPIPEFIRKHVISDHHKRLDQFQSLVKSEVPKDVRSSYTNVQVPFPPVTHPEGYIPGGWITGGRKYKRRRSVGKRSRSRRRSRSVGKRSRSRRRSRRSVLCK